MEPRTPSSPSVTMKTVALRAGVTQATVSMSLANNPRISRSTREHVQAVARQLDYRPNPYVSMLMRLRRRRSTPGHRPVLAVICAQRTADGWRNHPDPAIRAMRESAFAQAAQRGYCAQEFWLHRDDMTSRRFSAMLYTRGIQGVLLGPLSAAEPPPRLGWEHFAVVSLGEPHAALPIAHVCHDHFLSAHRTWRECRDRGYRRPGLVFHANQWGELRQRWHASFLAIAQAQSEIGFAPPLTVEDWSDPAIKRWLEREHPDVVISLGGRALLDALGRSGRCAPDDLGFVSLAGSPCDADISGIRHDGNAIGALAIDTLVNLLERHQRGPPAQATTMMVEGRWNEGRTLRGRPYASG